MKQLWACTALLVFLAQPSQAPASSQPEQAIGFDNGAGAVNNDVTAYGARLRLTRSTWEYLKLTLRDTFAKWDFKGGDGFNLIIDPGYDHVTKSAGPIRTTPFAYDFARYDSKSIGGPYVKECNCGLLDCECRTRSCGTRTCGGWSWVNAGWSQVRRPGFQWDDTPVVPWQCRNYGFQEYGFNIPAVGSSATGGPCPTTATYFDYNEFQACSSYFSYDKGSGKAGQCTTAALDAVVASIDYNARIFIYPNMRQENTNLVDPTDNWNPSVAPGFQRGPYASTSWNNVRYSTETGCANGGTCGTTSVGQCCDTICTCGDWGICNYSQIYPANCNATWTANYYAHHGVLPTSTAAYNPRTAYSQTTGTYFRQGDDTAVYLNIYQMQIQSTDRVNAYKPPTCGFAEFYTGLSSGQPRYLTDTSVTPNCMRPKMYWYDDPSNPAKSEWRQCQPFDTWNSDGTLNPTNDDAKFIYPGNPANGRGADGVGVVSTQRCGRQRCTSGYCASAAGGWAWGAGSWTSNLNDIYSDNDGQLNPATGRLRGTGWYGMKLADGYPRLNAADNRIDIRFTANDLRLEMAAEADVHSELIGIFNLNFYNNKVMGRLLIDQLLVDATLHIYSIDDQSCVNGYDGSCGGLWSGLNAKNLLTNGTINPDKVIVDAVITNVSITPGNGGNWFQGTSSCIFDWPWPFSGCAISMAGILNNGLIQGQLLPPIEDAIKGALKGAMGSITSALPNLNGILGNPIELGTALVDTGIFMSGTPGAYQLANPPAQYPRKWPVYVSQGPTAAQNLVEMNLSVGFKPIAFRPAGANGVMDVDLNDPPLADSVYGVPELWKVATRRAGFADCPYSVAGDTCPGGVFTPGPGCSKPAHYAYKDADQTHDSDEYCRGRKASTTDAFYYHPKTGNRVNVAWPNVFPDFWKGPISEFKKPPDWCMVVNPAVGMPRTLRTGATGLNLRTLYPNTRWLSFDSTWDNPPAVSGMIDAGKTAVGNWDTLPATDAYGNVVVIRQNQNNNIAENVASKLRYDMSMHIHQRTLAQFAQSVFASGVGCLEFAAQDTTGADTIWKSFLATERFAAFIPEIQTLYPKAHVKLRIMPTQTPRIRVGMGNLSFTPQSRQQDSVRGALPVSNQPYLVSAALPNMHVQILVTDPTTGNDIPILTFYWNTVLGFYAKAVRQCYHGGGTSPLDPLYTKVECTSEFTNVRTVSGYYELFFDINGQEVVDLPGGPVRTGNNILGRAWESPANTRDGFAAGRFSRAEFVCPECSPSVPAGQAMFQVIQSYCDGRPDCDSLGLAQVIPSILSSTIQAFVVTRLSFYNLTVDFLYVGPDGYNDDGLGYGPGYRSGDHLGIYARFLGNLNVFGLLDAAAFLAPAAAGKLEPQAVIEGVEQMQYLNTSTPAFDVKLSAVPMVGDPSPIVSYTYSLDDGFWHTPVDWPTLQLPRLTEGEHKLTIRTLQDSELGAAANLTPTVLRFNVDTIPPAVAIPPASKGFFRSSARVVASDLQTPADQLRVEYSFDDGEWGELSGSSIALGDLPEGRHVLRARATDLAGNTGTAAREIVIRSKGGWGCDSARGGGGALAWVALVMSAYALRRRRGRA